MQGPPSPSWSSAVASAGMKTRQPVQPSAWQAPRRTPITVQYRPVCMENERASERLRNHGASAPQPGASDRRRRQSQRPSTQQPSQQPQQHHHEPPQQQQQQQQQRQVSPIPAPFSSAIGATVSVATATLRVGEARSSGTWHSAGAGRLPPRVNHSQSRRAYRPRRVRSPTRTPRRHPQEREHEPTSTTGEADRAGTTT